MRAVRRSAFPDAMTANDPKRLDLPASGELFGESVESQLSRQSVPVARIAFRSVDGEALIQLLQREVEH